MTLADLTRGNRILLFTRSHRAGNSAGHGARAIGYLETYGATFLAVDVDPDRDLRADVESNSGWRTYPQLFVDGEFIGGSFIIPEFLRSGELHRILTRDDMHRGPWPHADHGPFPQASGEHRGPIWALCFSRDVLISASADHTIQLRDRTSATLLRTLHGHSGWVNCLAAAPGHDLIASGSSDTTVRVWDTNGCVLHVLQGHRRWVNSVLLTPDGAYVISGSADGTIRVWRSDTGTPHLTINTGLSPIWSLVLVDDLSQIAAAHADGTVSIWSMSTAANVLRFRAHGSTITSMAHIRRPDSSALMTASYDAHMIEWTDAGHHVRSFTEHRERIWGIASSPDGAVIASIGADRRAIVRRSDEGEVREFLFSSSPTSCALAADGRVLAVGLHTGSILWLPVR